MFNLNIFKNLRGSSLLFLGLLLSFSSFFISGCMKDDGNLEEELRKQQEAYLKQLGVDTMLIKEHLSTNNIPAKSTKTGLFILETKAGTGIQAVANNRVSVQYTLKDLDGKSLQNGTFPFTLGVGQVVQGFDQGVLTMKVGGKSTFYVPSLLGYRDRTDLPGIKPNMVLVFEVELLSAE